MGEPVQKDVACLDMLGVALGEWSLCYHDENYGSGGKSLASVDSCVNLWGGTLWWKDGRCCLFLVP